MRKFIITSITISALLLGTYSCSEDPATDELSDSTEQNDNNSEVPEDENEDENNDDQTSSSGVTTLDLVPEFPEVDGYPTFEINPTIVENSNLQVNVVEIFGAKGDGETDDSTALQSAIDLVAASSIGGIVYMPLGEYVLHDIYLKSNVHLHIEAGSTITMPASSSNTSLFLLGTDEFINNVVVRGVNGRFTIDLVGMTAKPRTFRLKSIHNFLISDIDFQDYLIEFPMIGLGPDADQDPDIFGPTNGVIRNCSSYGGHYGYGLIQVQCAKQVYFENLYGEGGVVLRFETGEDSMNESQFGGVFDCRGQDISGKNGNATVMISPHAMQDGRVQVDGITAVSMGIGVRIDAGYDYTYTADDGTEITVPAGTYTEGAYISNINCTFGTDAQVKTKHLKYMPEELLDDVPDPYSGTICQPSPSVCAILYVPNYPLGILGDVVATGYLNDAIVTEEAERS
ncbi:MAG: glycosyl hydrolase family 28-related protein [Rikenellaceae bacterium]